MANGQYGGSQAGLILSYAVLARPGLEAGLYGRASVALSPLAQEEVAVGAMLRPFRSLPLSLHAEQRLNASSGGSRGTALFLAGGTGPHLLVETVTFETYAQAGYVFGKPNSHFFDGSATVERPIAGIGRGEMRLGAGVWAGGQRHLTRLDVGPRVEFILPVADLPVRIAMDWRFRVAGEARPDSGLAITVAAGF